MHAKAFESIHKCIQMHAKACVHSLPFTSLGVPWRALACLGLPWPALACLGDTFKLVSNRWCESRCVCGSSAWSGICQNSDVRPSVVQMHSLISFIECLSMWQSSVRSLKSWTICCPWRDFLRTQCISQQIWCLTTLIIFRYSSSVSSMKSVCASGIRNCPLYTDAFSLGLIIFKKIGPAQIDCIPASCYGILDQEIKVFCSVLSSGGFCLLEIS